MRPELAVRSGAAEPVSLIPLAPQEDHGAKVVTTLFDPAPPEGARYILVQALVQNIRYTIGTYSAPNVAFNTGFRLNQGDPPILIPLGPGVDPKFIAETAGAVLQYQWCE